jgi:hypothetical protein
MAWDANPSRRRATSSATARQPQNPVTHEPVVPKSTHTSDLALQPFLAPSFDPAEFLNNTLPPLQALPSKSPRSSANEVPLGELSTQTQTLLSHLSAHTTRLTTTLTQLTDEILRSGSRLAYEVEVLRGETIGLSETLTEGLQDDVSKFVPAGLDQHLAKRPSKGSESSAARRRSSTLLTPRTPIPTLEESNAAPNTDPEYITKLRTLSLVRNRLDTVIKTFGDAMAWTFPPSEVSIGSGFLSVSAPEPGSDAHSTEERGKEVSKKLREEIADLLVATEDPVDGIEAAAKRVEELKELAKVWQGTAEEKARIKFVEGLAMLVEDKHQALLREAEKAGRAPMLEVSHPEARADAASTEGRFGWPGSTGQGGYGFINQLQKMRGGL